MNVKEGKPGIVLESKISPVRKVIFDEAAHQAGAGITASQPDLHGNIPVTVRTANPNQYELFWKEVQGLTGLHTQARAQGGVEKSGEFLLRAHAAESEIHSQPKIKRPSKGRSHRSKS